LLQRSNLIDKVLLSRNGNALLNAVAVLPTLIKINKDCFVREAALSLSVTTEEMSVRVGAIVDARAELEGPLLPILHDVQKEFGFVPQPALQIIASRLNLSRAEVHGVASFYHDFREEHPGRHVLKICRAEACQSMGADRVANHAKRTLNVDWHETTADDAITLEPVYCLGLCACAPAALMDDKLVGRVDEDRLDTLIGEARS